MFLNKTKTIKISLDEYKELLIIKGKYDAKIDKTNKLVMTASGIEIHNIDKITGLDPEMFYQKNGNCFKGKLPAKAFEEKTMFF